MSGHKNNWGRIICALSAFFMTSGLHAHFQNNIVDPSPLYTPKGLNKFPTVNVDKKNGRAVDMVNISVSPYYMTVNNGYDKNSGGVKNGDIYGYWNLLGFFLGKKGVDNVTSDSFTDPDEPDWTVFSQYPNIKAVYTRLLASTNGHDYVTDGEYIDPSRDTTTDTSLPQLFTKKYGQFSVEAALRRMGVRSEIEWRIIHNLRATVRTGFTDYRVRPIFRDLGTNNTSTDEATALGLINTDIVPEYQYRALFRDVGLSIDPYSTIALEDTHAQLSYDYAFPFKSTKGTVVLNVVPYLSVGLWIPTGPKKDQNRAFQIPTGNNGLFAGTADFAVSLDFKDMITFAFGGGLTLTADQDSHLERVPTSTFQAGFFPWKSGVKRDTGTTWYLNASMQCLNFTDGFSFYGDITIAAHEADRITITETNTTKATLLTNIGAAGHLSGLSAWRSQNYNVGIDVEFTPNLTMGFGMQGSLGGVKITRNITLLGSLRFEF